MTNWAPFTYKEELLISFSRPARGAKPNRAFIGLAECPDEDGPVVFDVIHGEWASYAEAETAAIEAAERVIAAHAR